MKNYPATAFRLFICFIVFSISSCKHGPSKLEIAMDSWVGKPVGELLSAWGAPDASIKLDDGTSALTWNKVWYWNQYRHECRKSFTVGIDGNVKSWSYNDC